MQKWVENFAKEWIEYPFLAMPANNNSIANANYIGIDPKGVLSSKIKHWAKRFSRKVKIDKKILNDGIFISLCGLCRIAYYS